MLGIKLVTHSLQLIFDNLGMAIKISAVPVLLLLVVEVLTVVFGISLLAVAGGSSASGVGSFFIIFAIAVVIVFFAVYLFAVLAVAWHRFVLLNERPTSIFPNIPKGSAGAYIWRSIRLGLWMVLICLPVLFLWGTISTSLMANDNWIGLGLLYALTVVFVSYISFRLSIVLPAKALGSEMKIGEAWEHTRRVSTALIAAVLVIVVVQVVLGFLVEGLPDVLSIVIGLILDWVVLMFGISILTTLYGYCVEGRDLPE